VVTGELASRLLAILGRDSDDGVASVLRTGGAAGCLLTAEEGAVRPAKPEPFGRVIALAAPLAFAPAELFRATLLSLEMRVIPARFGTATCERSGFGGSVGRTMAREEPSLTICSRRVLPRVVPSRTVAVGT
jgi:hypothetical protein